MKKLALAVSVAIIAACQPAYAKVSVSARPSISVSRPVVSPPRVAPVTPRYTPPPVVRTPSAPPPSTATNPSFWSVPFLFFLFDEVEDEIEEQQQQEQQ